MKVILFLGAVFFIFSYILSFSFHYNHFYEFTLIGLFLILFNFVPRKFLTYQNYFKLYVVFFLGGLFADLFLGQYITKLWVYSYSSNLEYIPLYVLIYPLGGIVMVQTFLFLKNLFKLQIPYSKKRSFKNLKFFIYGLSTFLLIVLIFKNSIPYFGTLLFTLATLLAFFVFNYRSQRLRKTSYLLELVKTPFKTFLITSLSGYSQALIHEVPNIFAKQWVYQNFPFSQATFFNIPIFVFFVGWLFLVIIPISIYYNIKK